MISKFFTAAAALVAFAFGASQAQAYTLHYWQDGTISWMCNDGITVGVMDDGSMPPEEVIIAHCAGHGGIAKEKTGAGASQALGVEKPAGQTGQAKTPTRSISR